MYTSRLRIEPSLSSPKFPRWYTGFMLIMNYGYCTPYLCYWLFTKRVLEINTCFFLEGSNVCLEFCNLESIRSPTRSGRFAIYTVGSFQMVWIFFRSRHWSTRLMSNICLTKQISWWNEPHVVSDPHCSETHPIIASKLDFILSKSGWCSDLKGSFYSHFNPNT